ncbi:zinc-ribbon domain-containing protein [Candidatus Bathyarchaeota archaeon]|nr:zinc-ribbon domain-containing protein [Candidatus Bathyarchaeota archaeon]
MRRIIRRKKSGYALGFALCLIGLVVLVAVLWEAWPNVSASNDVLSALEAYLWAKQLDFGAGFELKLMHLTIMGAAVLVLGAIVLALSQQVFSVSAGKNVLLRCPYCKNQWRARRAMGHAECPHCRQFVQPTVMRADDRVDA